MREMSPSPSGANKTGIKKVHGTTLVILVVLVVVLSGVLSAFLYLNGFSPWLFSENPRYSHSFYLTIDPNSTSEFTVVCPVPVNESGSQYPGFIYEIEVTSGDPAYMLVETAYGLGLQVSGQGHTSLHWSGNWRIGDGDWYLNMTMTNAPCDWNYDAPDGGFWAWVHSSSSIVLIRLIYSADRVHNETPLFASGGGPIFRLSKYGSGDGWEQVPLDYGWKIIN